MDYFIAGFLGWLADRAPPFVAGFFGGIVGSMALTRLRARRGRSQRDSRRSDDETASEPS